MKPEDTNTVEDTTKAPTGDAKEVTSWEDLEKLLHTLASHEKQRKPSQLQLVGDILKSAVKLAKDTPGTLNLKIASTTLKELRFSFKTFGAHKGAPKITMFGSARVPEGTPVYDLAKGFAAEAVKRNYMIITGGGPGIMQAGNEGAESKGGFGLNIRLPFEQTANPFIDQKNRLIHYKYFFTRKLFLVKEACAFAFFPGGFGTFDEAFEVLTLLQTGKTTIIPIVLVEPKGFGFWTSFVKFVDETVLKKGFISPTDKNLYHIVHSAAEGIDHIEKFYRVFHSMRFVKKLSVLRLKKKPSEKLMKKLQSEFGFLAGGDQIQLTGALPEEANEPEIAELPRLVLPFDRKDMGSLRRLIDFINENAV